MSLPQKDDTVAWVVKKRKTMPDAICWGCKKRKDEYAPHLCKGRARYQSGYCVDLEPSGGVS